MRITNSMLISSYVKNLNRNSDKISKLQAQLSSGSKLLRASDDPLAANKAMGIRSNLSKISQYSNNVTQAKQWLTQSETSLNEMNSLLTRAYELNVKAANDSTNGEDERSAIANEIGQIAASIVESLNTAFAGRYIFGGTNTTQKPYEVKEISGKNVLFYNGKNLIELSDPANAADLADLQSQHVSSELGYGAKLDISYNGIDLAGVGADNIYSVLDNLKNALLSGDMDVVKESISKLQTAKGNVLSVIGEIGGKTNRLDAFATRLENDKYNYEQMQKDTEGIDIYDVLLQLQSEDVVYQSALSSGATIIKRTLADYL